MKAITVHMVPTADKPKGLAADARSWTRWDGKTEVMTASCGRAGKTIKAYSGEWRDVTCMSCMRSTLMRRGRISRGTPLTRDEALRMLDVAYPEQRNGVCDYCGHAGRVVRDYTRMGCADDRACGGRIREQGAAALRAALYGERPPAPNEGIIPPHLPLRREYGGKVSYNSRAVRDCRALGIPI